jgi:LytS/YehU family sensor histidine kinase
MDWIMWHGPFQSETTRKNAKYNWEHYHFPRQSFHLTFLNLLSITGFAYFLNRWKEEKIMRELKEQHLQMELNFLKVQIQPHFFFNTLSNIYALTIQKSDKAAPLIAKHAETMRYVLYESLRTQVELKKEINFLKNYVDVESMHYSGKINITFEAQGVSESALIEPMLLLPFVENTFKHGIREETTKGYVHIIISLVEDDLFVEIKNSKPQNIHGEKINGIGLLNASKRLQMLYPDKHKIEIQESDYSYELRLSLILKTE